MQSKDESDQKNRSPLFLFSLLLSPDEVCVHRQVIEDDTCCLLLLSFAFETLLVCLNRQGNARKKHHRHTARTGTDDDKDGTDQTSFL